MSPNASSGRAGRSKKAPRRTLETELCCRPFDYDDSREQRERLRYVLKTCGERIPTVFIAIMFGRARSSIVERLRRLGLSQGAAERSRQFMAFLRTDTISELRELSLLERLYLSSVRKRAIETYLGSRRREPGDYAEKLAKALQQEAKTAPRRVPRTLCSNEACGAKLPALPRFFPNLRQGGKSAGRCAVCLYRQKAAAARRLRAAGPSRPAWRRLPPEKQSRFWQVEQALRFELPNRVLAALFGISSSTVNKMRKLPLSRAEAKAVFHRFQTLSEAPRYTQLSAEENRIVGEQWRAVRSQLTRREFASAEEHRDFLRRYTSLHPEVRRAPCADCGEEFAADEHCFPYSRDRRTRAKVLRRCCRACYAVRW